MTNFLDRPFAFSALAFTFSFTFAVERLAKTFAFTLTFAVVFAFEARTCN